MEESPFATAQDCARASVRSQVINLPVRRELVGSPRQRGLWLARLPSVCLGVSAAAHALNEELD